MRTHSAAWRQASSTTHAPIGTIRPVCSAIGMKTGGTTMPRSGWYQRISASAPTILPLFMSTCGW